MALADTTTFSPWVTPAPMPFSTLSMPDCPRRSARQMNIAKRSGPLLSRMAAVAADVAVIEVGASPLEPYNGAVTIKEIGRNVRMTILCASDPYAVLGVMSAFEVQPDLVTGIVANTGAGRELVEKLSSVRALNLKEPSAVPEMTALLQKKLWGEDPSGFSPWVIWSGL